MSSPTIRPMLERFAYLCYMALLICSLGITWVGWMIGLESGDFRTMLLALSGLAVSRWLHVHGHAHWHFRECAESLDAIDLDGNPGPMSRSEQEERLSAEISVLFTHLESEDDVWVRGGLRREIGAKLALAPSLRAEFADSLARHPEM